RIVGALAAKVGINGHAAAVAPDEQAARRAVRSAEQAAALLEVHLATLDALPFDAGSFDVVVVHNLDGLLAGLGEDARAAAVREWHRVLRPAGRVVVIEPGTRTGLGALLRPAPRPDE